MILQRYLSIRRILVLVGLFFLLLPVGSIYFLRIYESALLRQTESELISQGAFVAAFYKQEIRKVLSEKDLSSSNYGIPIRLKSTSEQTVHPILPRLDLAKDRLYPARPSPLYTSDKLDALAHVAGKYLIPVLQDGQRITLSGIKVLDYQGIVVAGSEENGLSFSHVEEFQMAKLGIPISLLRVRRMPKNQAPLSSVSRNSNVNVFVALPILLDNRLIGVVWLNRTPMDISQALYGKRTELAWTIFGLLLAATFIILMTSLTITQPIRALVQKTRLIAQGQPEGLEPLKHPITREISELSDNIAGMAAAIQYRTEYIQNFTAHVSHEFKTPLTAIRGSIELLEDNLDEMPGEQQKRFLHNMAMDTDRLNRLVSRLLELARADMIEKASQKSDLMQILRQVSARYNTEALSIDLQLPEGHESLMVAVSSESLEAVLSNLIENSRQAGANRVSISAGFADRILYLDVQDDGPGISEANRKDIFTPFFTTRRDAGGTGLGLSIAQSLLERHRSKITLESTDLGAHFRIAMPLV